MVYMVCKNCEWESDDLPGVEEHLLKGEEVELRYNPCPECGKDDFQMCTDMEES